ncbi:HAD-IIIC family phosphatase [Streptomyces reniochalinae]|uniref:HAD-IIIC family phosphatase n=1 Tax=Streptomyces reniochalinae TaxID=2250578 RepID=A0A367E6C4_9ACTN|nr:HAD-IIIC family phosphatase [Streptomyces reniochalinae]RCG13604.1 HAD-IIIC family phosphatase [Streptomyces reniochalinae]
MAAEPAAPDGGGADSPADVLLRMHRQDELVPRYPEVERLLAGMTGPELLRAGNLLSRLDPDHIVAAHPAVPALTVAVTGHGTLGALLPALTAELARHGLLLRARLSDFDSYVFDLGDPGSDLYASRPEVALCVLDAAVVFDEVATPWQPDDVERAAAEKLALLEGLADRFADSCDGTLVLNTVPLPRRFTAQLVDHRSRARLGAVWREFNTGLLRLAEDRPSLAVLDLDPLVAAGVAAEDVRLSVYAKAGLSPPLLAEYAREVGHLARHVAGRTKKVLVLDLDGTVWGGVLGDDGPDGIEVSGSYRGEAFAAFQDVVEQLASQGVLLAAASKNDVEPVRRVLREHPGMRLGEEHFVRIAAGWGPKHEAIAETAAALNLGTDAFVFVDDSAYERGLVRRELPDVTVVAVDDEPALHTTRLLRDGWFDSLRLTSEDHARVSRYRQEADRRDFLDGFSSVEDYLRELEVTVRLAAPGPAELPRVSQLTLRTNQFNMTTVRMQPAEVGELMAAGDTQVLAVHSSDRFGDNGLVGALFLRRERERLHIDNFVLSCRVFSRGIEQACLSSVLRHARQTGATSVTGTYRRTAKNGKVAGLYTAHGFTEVTDDGTTAAFRHDLHHVPAPPPHVHLTGSFAPHAEL